MVVKQCHSCGKKNYKRSWQNGKTTFSRCLNCGLEWKDYIPPLQDLINIYNQGYFSQDKDYGLEKGYADYEMFSNMYVRYFTDMMNKIKNIDKKDGMLIDVGCGPGIFLSIAQQQGYQVMGIDISNEAASLVRKKYKIKVIKEEFPKIDFSGKDISVITAFQTIEHVRKPYKLIRAINRALMPGGLVLMTTLNLDSIWRKIMGKHWFSYLHEEHLHYWGEEALTSIFNRAGFEDMHIFPDNWRWYTLDQIIINMRVYGNLKIPKLNSSIIKSITQNLDIPFPVGSIGIVARKKQ